MEGTRKLFTSEYINSCAKKKEKISLFNEGTIDYNQQCHPLHLTNKQYKKFPQKKKRVRTRKGGRRKRRREEGRMRKRGRESGKKKEKEKKEEEKIEKAVLKMHRSSRRIP